ncbi:CHAT domain-containing protein [Paraburkholderia flagellata]|uniref:CHAT domain-containing protein n=1 Tax=Paraburkholderia flagellata TaxID=2883241 RepID=UPI001F16F696|nr:CHAT domain-containing protein [Paraburkholderia flagellata]
MNTVIERAEVVLITDDNDNAALINAAWEDLVRREGAHQDVHRFIEAIPTRWVSVAMAEEKLGAIEKGENPVLIILDIMVRKETRCGMPGTGAAGLTLLDWLTANKPDVPVIVLRAHGVEGIEARLLRRLNIASLSIGHDDFNGAFSKAASWLTVKSASSRRRITVKVGHYDACYSINDGYREVKSEPHQYASRNLLDELGHRTDAFKPAGPGWQDTVRELGDAVFKSVIAGTIGPHILTLLRQRAPTKNESSSSVDLRFEIFVPRNESTKHFGVPFELAKPPEDIDNYLCTRVPMARRMCFEDTLDEDPASGTEAWPPDRPLRMLFINASFDGNAIAVHERTGNRIQVDVGRLENTAAELKAVKQFATPEGGGGLELPTVLGGAASRICAQTIRDQFEAQVTNGNFDIVHFAGHSVTLDDGGGTFLILPGKNGQGIAISVREIAEWIRQGGSRLVFVLSSCSGSSLRTAIETMRAGAKAVIGFRWDVNDHACVEYFRRFYTEYIRNKKTLPEAYCEACRRISLSQRGLPIWASAIAVVRD